MNNEKIYWKIERKVSTGDPELIESIKFDWKCPLDGEKIKIIRLFRVQLWENSK